MQETRLDDKTIRRELFAGTNANKSMDARLAELELKGETLERRVKIGRNEPCYCGSGKKFKRCCLLKEGYGAGVSNA